MRFDTVDVALLLDSEEFPFSQIRHDRPASPRASSIPRQYAALRVRRASDGFRQEVITDIQCVTHILPGDGTCIMLQQLLSFF